MHFRNEYDFLSNMYPCPITYNGHTFQNVEAAFQAQKDLSRVSEFENLDGKAAKQLGRRVQMRPDWETVKLGIMQEILRVKFSDPALAERLKGVNEPIVEDNTWNDTYWGVCNGRGENHLGQLLETVKSELEATKEKKDSLTVCFTGHRAKGLCGYNQNSYNGFVKWMETTLLPALYEQDVRTYITGGAQGFDQLAYWAVNNFKNTHPDIQNVVYVPFRGQENRWAEAGLFSKQQYHQMLRMADDVVYLREVNTADGKAVRDALMERNHDMVNASNMVVALLAEDNFKTASGGTAECMRYASSRVPMYQIHYNISRGTLIPTSVTSIVPEDKTKQAKHSDKKMPSVKQPVTTEAASVETVVTQTEKQTEDQPC